MCVCVCECVRVYVSERGARGYDIVSNVICLMVFRAWKGAMACHLFGLPIALCVVSVCVCVCVCVCVNVCVCDLFGLPMALWEGEMRVNMGHTE